MPPAPGSRPLAAAVTGGFGALVTLGARWMLPGLSSLDAFGQSTPSASDELLFALGSLALGALLGAMTYFPGRRATLTTAFLAAPLAWALLTNVAAQQTMSSMTSGAALTAGLLMSPVFLVVAAFSLGALLVFCVLLSLMLVALARVVAAKTHTVQVALLGVWALNAAVLIASLAPPPEPQPQVVTWPEPPPLLCADPPFTDALGGVDLPLNWKRVLPETSTVEFAVAGPENQENGPVEMARRVLQGLSPCLLRDVRWSAVVVRATDVPVTFHLRVHAPPGTDRVNFQNMLDSQFHSVFDAHLHLSTENFATTSVQEAWSTIPKWVPRAFTCQSTDADVHCSGDTIELRRVGAVPRHAGVKVDFVK